MTRPLGPQPRAPWRVVVVVADCGLAYDGAAVLAGFLEGMAEVTSVTLPGRLHRASEPMMMEWERPLMAAHADVLLGRFPDPGCQHLLERTDLRVLNVGHGLGIVDSYIQRGADRLSKHAICEPHPDVLKRMDAWRRKPRVDVRAETWQQALEDPDFGPFDAIFFDTYAETYADMRAFFDALPRLLAPGGVFSYFNGVAPFNPFFHGVACEFIKTELAKLGLETTFVPLQVDQIQHDTWDGLSLIHI